MTDTRDNDAEEENFSITPATSAIDAPTVFADGIWFAANFGGAIRLTFMETILEPLNSKTPGSKGRHVGTIAMPRGGFNNMVAYLNTMKAAFDEMDAQNEQA